MANGEFWAFLVAITALTISPGADTMMVTRNSARGGFTDGVITSLGICLGLFVHAAISAGGVSLILMGSPKLFKAFTLLGAFYLIYLGGQSIAQGIKNKSFVMDSGNPSVKTGSVIRSLREGFLSNTLNPKTGVFYLAFLPQFIDTEGSLFWQAQALALVHFIISMSWQSLIAATVGQAQAFLSRPKIAQRFNIMIGLMLVGFGLMLGFG